MVALAAQKRSGFSIPRMRTKIRTTRIRASALKVNIRNILCEFKIVYTLILSLSIGKMTKKSPRFLCVVTKGFFGGMIVKTGDSRWTGQAREMNNKESIGCAIPSILHRTGDSDQRNSPYVELILVL